MQSGAAPPGIRHRPGLRLRSIRATGPRLCRASVNPLPEKYSTLPKFGFGVCVAHPGSFLRGDLVVVTFASRACGGRGSVRVREVWAGRIALREPKASFRRAALPGFVSSVSFRLRRQGWEYCGEMAGRAYGKTVWSWPSLLRSSLGEGGTCVNRRGAGEFREGEGGQKELGSRESTA